LSGSCETVDISGAYNTVRIGSSQTILVAGNANEVRVDTTDRITVDGAYNTVLWGSGSNGGTPKITSNNSSNEVKRG
jgi:hypothetical protein